MTDQIVPVSDAPPPHEKPPAKAIVTIQIQRSHLYLIVGMVAAFIAGVVFAKTVLTSAGAPIAAGSAGDVAAGEPAAAAKVDVSIDGAPFQGPADAAVTIVEFTDYQCPFCKRHHDEVLEQLLQKHKDVKYVVRNMPLAELHPDATKAAEAAMCVLDQDEKAFWTYRSDLFAHQDALKPSDLKRYAKGVDGIDAGEFADCLDDGDMADRVAKDLSDAQSYGVTGTPTFFVNGEPLKGAMPLNAIETAIKRNR